MKSRENWRRVKRVKERQIVKLNVEHKRKEQKSRSRKKEKAEEMEGRV